MKPWGQFDNLLKLYQIVFVSKQTSIESLEWAKDQLLLWQIKDNKFEYNVEIDATLSLVTALIHDKRMKCKPNSGLTNLDLKSFYSISIVKFCNVLPYYKVRQVICFNRFNFLAFFTMQVISHTGCTKRTFTLVKRSTNEVGRELNLPDWIMECRHNICHSYGVSIILLRQASYLALSWLDKHFWSRLVKTELTQNQENSINVRSIIDKIVECKVSRKRRCLYRIFNKKICHNWAETFDIIASTLISATCLDLSQVDFKNHKLNNQILIKYQRLLIISTINHNILLLFDSLANNFKDTSSTVVSVASIWLITLINGLRPDQNSFRLFRILKHNYSKNDSQYSKILWLRLLYKVCHNLNEYTYSIIEAIEKQIPEILPSQYIEALKCISFTTANYKCLEFSSSPKDDTSIKTVEDLKALKLELIAMETDDVHKTA